jgi:L-alanine-DL-glutamate epimerase-like enolase superfamily enzyme
LTVAGEIRSRTLARTLLIEAEEFPIAGRFTISRGSKTSAHVLSCTIEEDGKAGRGECVPYARYGESMDGVRDAIEAARTAIESGRGRTELQSLMPAGAARNALDCALWDLEAKLSGTRVTAVMGAGEPAPLVTAYTISLGTPEEMEAGARAASFRPLLKAKVGGEDDEARIRAIAAGAPDSRIILDANEGWTDANVARHLAIAAECNVALIEQPLPAGRDSILRTLPHLVPICADESLHVAGDLSALSGLYDAVNIKLDKTGGLTEALALRDNARKLGFQIMVGCMVGTSLAMAPAVLLAQGAEFVDLDGPLLLARDRAPGLRYDGSLVYPPEADVWG